MAHEGLEHGILIAADTTGTYAVRMPCCRIENAEEVSDADLGQGRSSDETIKVLSAATETANNLTA